MAHNRRKCPQKVCNGERTPNIQLSGQTADFSVPLSSSNVRVSGSRERKSRLAGWLSGIAIASCPPKERRIPIRRPSSSVFSLTVSTGRFPCAGCIRPDVPRKTGNSQYGRHEKPFFPACLPLELRQEFLHVPIAAITLAIAPPASCFPPLTS